MISEAQRAEIRRLFYAEHWRVGTIAAQLSLHPDTVRAALETARFNRRTVVRKSQLDPYVPFLRATLEQYPKLRATRLHEMIVARGYTGSVTQTRALVRRLRPRPLAEAYLRLRTLPGEQAQVDWGHFGHLEVGRARRSLSAFVMVLSWSRAIHVLFTLDQTMESFLRGHVEAFAYFQGAARTLLYDNLKSAVLARQGNTVEFHPRLLELAGHYHYLPRPCAVARGNEKGRVERQIRFLRDRFFAARRFRSVDDLNAQFLQWRGQWAHARPCPGDPSKTVAEALDEERPRLLPPPAHPFECSRVLARVSGKTPYLRFDRNDYSIPPDRVRKPLTLVATPQRGPHPRSHRTDRPPSALLRPGTVPREPGAHRGPRRLEASGGRTQGTRCALRAPAPRRGLLRGHLGARPPAREHHAQLRRLLEDHGPKSTDAALALTLERGTPTPSSVAHWLEQQRRRSQPKPALPVELPKRADVRDLRVTPHDLEVYDELFHEDDPD